MENGIFPFISIYGRINHITEILCLFLGRFPLIGRKIPVFAKSRKNRYLRTFYGAFPLIFGKISLIITKIFNSVQLKTGNMDEGLHTSEGIKS